MINLTLSGSFYYVKEDRGLSFDAPPQSTTGVAVVPTSLQVAITFSIRFRFIDFLLRTFQTAACMIITYSLYGSTNNS